MTFTFFIIIIIIGTCCATVEWYHISKILYALSIMLFLAVGCGPIPTWLLRNLQSAYSMEPTIQWGKHNVIVLLGAGTEKILGTDFIEPGMFSYGRIVKAAELYNHCRKTGAECKIIVSGGDAKHTGQSEAIVYRKFLLELRVEAPDIILEPDSMNTWQNAQFTRIILQRNNINQIFLVSSGFHLQRSVLYFTHFGVHSTPVRADYLRAIPSLLPLSYNFAVADFALHEYVGMARYYVYNALGWNSER